MPAVSDDARYDGIDPADVVGSNEDLPIPVPQVIGVTQLDGAPAGHLRIAIDFSEAMDPTAASQAANYTIALRNGAGLQILSASYADAGGHHRVTLEGSATGGGTLSSGTYDVRLNPQNLKSAAGVAMAGGQQNAVVLVDDINSVVTVGLQEELQRSWVPRRSDTVHRRASSPKTSTATASSMSCLPAGVSDEYGGQMLFLRGLGGGRFADPVAYDLDRRLQCRQGRLRRLERRRQARRARQCDQDLLLGAICGADLHLPERRHWPVHPCARHSFRC